MSEAKGSGLEGVIAADTAISDVDGERGRLVIAGAEVEQLVGAATFEQATTRVLAAAGADRARLGEALGQGRAVAWELLPRLGDALDASDGMDALRAGLAHLRSTSDDVADAIAAIGAAPVFVAAWHRKRAGELPIAPRADRGHA